MNSIFVNICAIKRYIINNIVVPTSANVIVSWGAMGSVYILKWAG